MKRIRQSLLALLMMSGFFLASMAGQAAETQYASPNDALQALKHALSVSSSGPELEKIFGSSESDLWNSGDSTQDQSRKQILIQRLSQPSEWVSLGDSRKVLYAGNDGWSFPIPLLQQGQGWIFDVKTGREEVFNRRIGGNEMDAIRAIQDYVRAQKEYFSVPRNGSILREYAQKFLSDENTKNGLYWKSADGKDPSPIGPAIQQANRQNLSDGSEALLYHGYYFKILKEQTDAKGTTKSYVKNGKMTQGFALLAYPAKWKNSGVMSFIVNQDGKILQKNLGENTTTLAEKIQAYDPSQAWTPVDKS